MRDYCYSELKQIETKASKLFEQAARAWVNANNNGRSTPEKRIERLRDEAENLLKPLGIVCDYPGLYPSYKVSEYIFHSIDSCLNEIFKIESRGKNERQTTR